VHPQPTALDCEIEAGNALRRSRSVLEEKWELDLFDLDLAIWDLYDTMCDLDQPASGHLRVFITRMAFDVFHTPAYFVEKSLSLMQREVGVNRTPRGLRQTVVSDRASHE
jgi:hypothetical protein